MKSNRKKKSIILLIIGIFSAFSTIIINNNFKFNAATNNSFNLDIENLKTSTISRPIHINNNWTDAKSAGICTGSGSESNPYVIQNIVIDAKNISSAITVENSNVYFFIRNCKIYNSSEYWYGVILANVTNGVIVNNNISNNNNGGLELRYCNGIEISGNTLNNNDGRGIDLDNCNDNKITGNNVNHNFHNGIEIGDGANNTVSRNNCNNNWNGVVLESSDENIISENTESNNRNCGILMGWSEHNTISKNTINNNSGNGIYLGWTSNNNDISNNLVFNNSDTGVYISFNGYENNVTLNCFINNSVNAVDDGSNNQWDNGVKGNYWSDYTGLDADSDGIGDVPYNVTGPAGSQDNFPLMECPISTQDFGGFSLELIIIISVISGGAGIGVATLLVIRRKRRKVK